MRFKTAGWQGLIPVGLSVLLAGAGDPRSLVGAAKSGDKDALRTLVKQKIDINAADGDGSTALHWTVYKDDLESTDLLIRSGAHVNAANDLGVTALWLASQNRSAVLVQRLLQAGANPNAALLSGETPLMVASRSGSPEIVEQLLAKGAHPNARGTRGQTALMWAATQKHSAVMTVLLAHQADVNARSDVWKEVMAVPPHGYLPYNRAIPQGGETPLLFSVRAGDLDGVKLLVTAGANVNDASAWGVTATTLAAHSGYRELVEFLLDNGADPNPYAAGFSALHVAIMRRDEKMVAALLAHGADPNVPLQTWTPTRRASQDFNFPPSLVGATPFWLAARYVQPNVMRLLMERGADPLVVYHADYIAGESHAHRTDTATAVMAVLGLGGGGRAWVDAPRSEREALALEAVKLLTERGVDLNVASSNGTTALDAAKNLKYESVVAFLTEHGAKAGSGKKVQVDDDVQ